MQNQHIFRPPFIIHVIEKFVKELIEGGWAKEVDRREYEIVPIAIIFEDDRITIK